jgi:NLR family CARD domain-containing protein 3
MADEGEEQKYAEEGGEEYEEEGEGINQDQNDEEKLVAFEAMLTEKLGGGVPGLSLAPFITQQIRDMEAIDMSGNNSIKYRFTDDCVKGLVECLLANNIMVQSISLRHHRLTSEAVLHLSEYFLQSLRLIQLDFEGNDIDAKGAEILASWLLSEHCNLLSLNLSSNSIGEEGGFHLAEALKVNMNIERLLLHNCGLNLKTVVAVVTCIAGNNNSRMSHLDIGRPLFSNTKNEELCDHMTTRMLLAPGTMIQMLDLKNCNIGDKGAGLIAQAMMFNSMVKYINLESNSVGVAGAEALASYLIERPHNGIEVLKLSYNQIANEGFEAMAEALVTNKSLKELTLKSNRARERGLLALGRALFQNNSLQLLTLLGNEFNDASGQLFGELGRDRLPFTNLALDVQIYVVDGVHLVAELKV